MKCKYCEFETTTTTKNGKKVPEWQQIAELQGHHKLKHPDEYAEVAKERKKQRKYRPKHEKETL